MGIIIRLAHDLRENDGEIGSEYETILDRFLTEKQQVELVAGLARRIAGAELWSRTRKEDGGRN